jgi:dCMP deaminase
MNRPNWNEYFFNIAEEVAKRSSCMRNKVGAVIVKDKNIISTGYNGAPKHQKNCAEIGFCYRDKHKIKSGTSLELCRAVGSHAEANAIALAAKHGHSTKGSIIYIVGHNYICNQCKAMIANAGIQFVLLYKGANAYYNSIDVSAWKIHPVDKVNKSRLAKLLKKFDSKENNNDNNR